MDQVVFLLIYEPRAKCTDHKSMGKVRIRNLHYGPIKQGEYDIYYISEVTGNRARGKGN